MMPAASRIGFLLTDFAPTTDPQWHAVKLATRVAFHQRVAELVAEEFDRQAAAGLDKDGRKLKRISARTRKERENPHYSPMGRADPNAPALTPCYGASRTRSLFRTQARESGVWCYWDADVHTGASWGVILRYHARGLVRGAPVRDVFGISAEAKARVQAGADAWWADHREGVIPGPIELGFAGRKATAKVDIPVNVGMPKLTPMPKPGKPGEPRFGRVEIRTVSGGVVHVDRMNGAGAGPSSGRFYSGFEEYRVPSKRKPKGAVIARQPVPQAVVKPVPVIVHRVTPKAVTVNRVVPAQPSVATPAGTKPTLTPLPLEEFGRRATEAARVSPTGKFGDVKTFISHAHRQAQQDPRLAGMPIDAFKRRLLEAHRARYLELARADLVEAMDPQDLADSEIVYIAGVKYYFIRHDPEE